MSQFFPNLTPHDREVINQFPSLVGFPNISPDHIGQKMPQDLGNNRRNVSTNLWEEEGTVCLVVELKGMPVTRRCDNNMINGTKLLNSAQISRGRRDGVLKGERFRHVVKVGGMNFKGVWIPFERALEMAHREKVLDDLYPLFLADLTPVLYSRQHYSRLRQQLAKGARNNPRFNDWIEGIPSHLSSYGPTFSTPSLASTTANVPERTGPNTGEHYSSSFLSNYPMEVQYPPHNLGKSSPIDHYRKLHSRNTGSSDFAHHPNPNLENYSKKLRQARQTRQRHRRGASSTQNVSLFAPVSGTQLPAHMSGGKPEPSSSHPQKTPHHSTTSDDESETSNNDNDSR